MLLGRSREVARIESLLVGARAGNAGSLVIRGEAGIGKTALLDWAADQAEDFRVLQTVGVESEAELACAGLHQLLRPLLDHLRELPTPQAAALRAALALDAAGSTDRFAVYAGTLGLIAAGADERPVLCLIDDAHWLDTVSAEALVFAARRLDAERVAMLFSARAGERASFAAAGIAELELAALDETASVELLRAAGRPLGDSSLPTLLRVARGNPLALLELPRGLSDVQLSGSAPIEDPMPVSGVIEAAFLARMHELSPGARQALLLAAASDKLSMPPLKAAGDQAALAELEATGLVRVEGGTVVFRHPLVRAAAYHAAPGGERRQAHAMLAGVLVDDSDREARAWHLAAAAAAPDEQTAALLEDAADRAGRRGSMAARARALARAAELTPDRRLRAGRFLEAGRAAWLAGQAAHASGLLDLAAPLVDDPPFRAELALTRAKITEGRQHLYSSLVHEAEGLESSDPQRAAEMFSYAHDYAWDAGRMEESRALVERAWALLGRALDLPTLGVSSSLAWQRLSDMDVAESLPLARETIEAAVGLNDPEGLYNAAFCAQLLVYAEDMGAQAAIDELTSAARDLGALPGLCWALIARSELGLRSGNVRAAYGSAAEAHTMGDLLGGWFLAHSAAALAHVEGMMGLADDCEQHADLATERAPGDVWIEAVAHRARGVLALGLGDLDVAVRELDLATSLVGAVEHPGFLGCHVDHVEALLRVGEPGRAALRLAELESRATRAGLERTLAGVLRCRVLTASEQSLDAAFARAVGAAARVSPLEEARACLCYGERLRRGARRADARVQLRQAFAVFEQLGAKPWAERASRELRASGATLRRDPVLREELTPQELQIAVTAAEGKTNREVGAALFISPKTVEKHLTSAYRKLGIHSRAQLIRLQLTQPAKLTNVPLG